MLSNASRNAFKRSSRLASSSSAAISAADLAWPGRNASFRSQNSEGRDTHRPGRLRDQVFHFEPDTAYQGGDRGAGSTQRYNFQIARVVDDRNAIRALRIALEMKQNGVKPDLTTYNHLLRALAAEGRYAEAWAVVEDMQRLGIRPNRLSCHHLMHAARFEDTRQTWRVFHFMEEQGEQINEESYGHLIDRSCQARNLEMCLRLCAEAESRGLVPTLPAVEATIRLAAELGYARLAIELAEDFETKSVRRISPATWIACLESSAEALYKEGVAECWHKVVTEFHITPHEGVCLAVLHTAARHGIPALANDVLKQLTTLQVPLQEYHLAPVLEAFAAEGELKAAFGVLSMMRSIGATPTLQTTTTVQNLVAKDADAVDRAWTALEEIHAGGEPVDVVALNTVLECCSRLQDLQRAIGIYKAAKDLGVEPDVTTYNILFAACTHLKHRELGDKLLEEMRAADIQPNHDTYHRFILLCLTQHNYEDAFFYLEEMKKAGFKPPMDVYQSIIRKCVAHKDSRYNIAVEEMVECGYPLTQALQDYIDSGGKPTKTTAHQETAPEEEEEETNHASIEEKASQFYG